MPRIRGAAFRVMPARRRSRRKNADPMSCFAQSVAHGRRSASNRDDWTQGPVSQPGLPRTSRWPPTRTSSEHASRTPFPSVWSLQGSPWAERFHPTEMSDGSLIGSPWSFSGFGARAVNRPFLQGVWELEVAGEGDRAPILFAGCAPGLDCPEERPGAFTQQISVRLLGVRQHDATR